MNPLHKVIINKDTSIKPIWIMRQAGRYLPEFRKIREKNQDFVQLCLNEKLVPIITLQPLDRFDLDAAIIFSDILMIPYGIGQKVKFEKKFGPKLGDIKEVNLDLVNNDLFLEKLNPIYSSMRFLSNKIDKNRKALIGFIGAPWTVLVYMLNRQSPKKALSDDLLNLKDLKKIMNLIMKFLKIHVEKQVENGADVIQIFDSWAGIVNTKRIGDLIYEPNAELVEFTKSLGVPVICFPREVKNYLEFVKEVNPSAISIDFNVDINHIARNVEIPIQGNLNPSVLLTNKETVKNETLKILDTFKNHPHIFNLGHGVLPQTDPNMVDYLVNLVKNY